MNMSIIIWIFFISHVVVFCTLTENAVKEELEEASLQNDSVFTQNTENGSWSLAVSLMTVDRHKNISCMSFLKMKKSLIDLKCFHHGKHLIFATTSAPTISTGMFTRMGTNSLLTTKTSASDQQNSLNQLLHPFRSHEVDFVEVKYDAISKSLSLSSQIIEDFDPEMVKCFNISDTYSSPPGTHFRNVLNACKYGNRYFYLVEDKSKGLASIQIDNFTYNEGGVSKTMPFLYSICIREEYRGTILPDGSRIAAKLIDSAISAIYSRNPEYKQDADKYIGLSILVVSPTIKPAMNRYIQSGFTFIGPCEDLDTPFVPFHPTTRQYTDLKTMPTENFRSDFAVYLPTVKKPNIETICMFKKLNDKRVIRDKAIFEFVNRYVDAALETHKK